MLICSLTITRENKGERVASRLGDPDGDDTNHFPFFQPGDTFLGYQPSLGLDFGLLSDRVLGEELIGGSECRVVMDIGFPLSKFRVAGRSVDQNRRSLCS